jgi:hypothetical protein
MARFADRRIATAPSSRRRCSGATDSLLSCPTHCCYVRLIVVQWELGTATFHYTETESVAEKVNIVMLTIVRKKTEIINHCSVRCDVILRMSRGPDGTLGSPPCLLFASMTSQMVPSVVASDLRLRCAPGSQASVSTIVFYSIRVVRSFGIQTSTPFRPAWMESISIKSTGFDRNRPFESFSAPIRGLIHFPAPIRTACSRDGPTRCEIRVSEGRCTLSCLPGRNR